MKTTKEIATSKKRMPQKRIPDSERTENALRSARKLFLDHGYEGVSLEMIVSEAGGSYRDLYKKFGDKEALFLRVVKEISEDVLKPLRENLLPKPNKNFSTEELLSSLGRIFLTSLLSPRVLALHRLIVSESIRFPELPKLFMEIGPESAYDATGAFIQEYFANESLEIDQPNIAARLFLDMISADLQLRALTGSKITESEIDDRIHRAVEIFVTGMRQTSKKFKNKKKEKI